MSLSSATNCSHLPDYIRTKARQELEEWEPKTPDINWIHQVLGYFQGMYIAKPGASRNLSDLHYTPKLNPLDEWRLHAGVLLIQQYYPDYVPELDDFTKAIWGNQPSDKKQ